MCILTLFVDLRLSIDKAINCNLNMVIYKAHNNEVKIVLCDSEKTILIGL